MTLEKEKQICLFWNTRKRLDKYQRKWNKNLEDWKEKGKTVDESETRNFLMKLKTELKEAEKMSENHKQATEMRIRQMAARVLNSRHKEKSTETDDELREIVHQKWVREKVIEKQGAKAEESKPSTEKEDTDFHEEKREKDLCELSESEIEWEFEPPVINIARKIKVKEKKPKYEKTLHDLLGTKIFIVVISGYIFILLASFSIWIHYIFYQYLQIT